MQCAYNIVSVENRTHTRARAHIQTNTRLVHMQKIDEGCESVHKYNIRL